MAYIDAPLMKLRAEPQAAALWARRVEASMPNARRRVLAALLSDLNSLRLTHLSLRGQRGGKLM